MAPAGRRLIRDLEKAGLTDGAAALAVGSRRRSGTDREAGTGASALTTTGSRPGLSRPRSRRSATYLHAKIQDLILKDMASARDESTPPEFKELVDRYYEVLSKSSGRASKAGLSPARKCTSGLESIE